MTTNEQELWEKIKNFSFNEPGTKFTFAKRLAKENGWSMNYTRRTILEYKKFIFLCTVSKEGVTPSDPVDQVWHLHLTYTQNYWKELCIGILGKEIHHNPTKGGESEATKFVNFYNYTSASYDYYFNEKQPRDIWQNTEERFESTDYKRININKFWWLKKPSLFINNKLAVFVVTFLALGFIFATGAEIFLYTLLGVIIVYFIIWLIKKIRRNKNGGSGSSGSGCSSGCNTSTGGFFIFGCSSSDSHSDSSSSCSSDGGSGCFSGCGGGCGGGD